MWNKSWLFYMLIALYTLTNLENNKIKIFGSEHCPLILYYMYAYVNEYIHVLYVNR